MRAVLMSRWWGDEYAPGFRTGWGQAVPEAKSPPASRQGTDGTAGCGLTGAPGRPVSSTRLGVAGRLPLRFSRLRALVRQRGCSSPEGDLPGHAEIPLALVPAPRPTPAVLLSQHAKALNLLANVMPEAAGDWVPLTVRYRAAEAALSVLSRWADGKEAS